ncbi:MAG: hypothetical protein VKP62_00515 [Candidatus Sericytochromatia bacterium]|nr:hypothetical protein [Candidatus Sericytochromatia bacterium]
MQELEPAERFAAMKTPEPSYWVAAGCVVGLLVSLYAVRRFERHYAETFPQANEKRQSWLDAQRLLLWCVVGYFAFVSLWVVVPFGLKLIITLVTLPLWAQVGLALVIGVGYLRGWFPGWRWRGKKGAEDDD